MDDFFEQMLSPWVDGAAMASINGIPVDSVGAMQGLSKMSPSHLARVIENPGSLQDGSEGGMAGENLQFASTKSASSPQTGQSHQAALQPSSGTSQAMLPVGGPARASLAFRNNMFDRSGISQGSSNLQSPPPLMSPTWRAPFSAAMSPVPAALGQGKSEVFSPIKDGMPGELHVGKRPRDDEDMVGGNMMHAAQPQGMHPGHGDGDQFPFGQGPSGTIRPRVRARRGQATDPHSIAERNRRERIAERMKALQELVPDSNKTDKASMLDEIISYVKFLQMQVKCLSMCRLGGAGAAAPLLADLPAEGAASFIAANLVQANGAPGPSHDGIAFAERQVARLMDEDMSAAMQYLQSKGLCLMPISLATAISSTGARQPTPAKGPDVSGAEKQAPDITAAAVSSSTSAPPNDVTSATDGLNEAGSIMPTLRDDTTACAFLPGSSSSSKKGLKSREELQR